LLGGGVSRRSEMGLEFSLAIARRTVRCARFTAAAWLMIDKASL
jgi:hypothetical protein